MWNSNKKKQEILLGSIAGNTTWTVVIMGAALIVALTFFRIGFSEAAIIMIFLLGVLLVSAKTAGRIYGGLASVVGVLFFNYYFTDPIYTFQVHDPQYLVTFTVMLVVALMTSGLTAQVKYQAQLSALRTMRSEHLYQISRNMLKVQGVREACSTAAEQAEILFGHEIFLTLMDKENISAVYRKNGNEDLKFSEGITKAARQVFRTGIPKELSEGHSDEALVHLVPIIGQSRVLGVVGMFVEKSVPLDMEQKSLFEGLAALVALTIERERGIEAEQNTKVEMERERLRSTLLRAISHDLRTPLTGISGAAGTLLVNFEILSDQVKKELLEGISEDVAWLIRLVENLLSMTRIEAGRPDIRKTPEVVEEVVEEAVRQVKKRSGSRNMIVNMPKELMMVPMDGNLIEQVLINLLENAIKHTDDGMEILLTVCSTGDTIRFEVKDSGVGIRESDIPHIFEPFYTGESSPREARKGSGLGLAICRSIIEAHGGFITAVNGSTGGAVFSFEIPAYESEDTNHE